MIRPTQRRRSVTTEEHSLWRLAMRGVEPMPSRGFTEPEVVPTPPAAGDLPAPVGVPSSPAPAPRPRPEPPPLAPGVTTGLDRRTGDRLRRGQLEIDGRIDLHGMVQSDAHAALTACIHRCWRDGRRCVLVITGKGRAREGGGVLARMVPRWLSEATLRPMVLAIQPAQPKHGGDGALYVLLKRRRETGRR